LIGNQGAQALYNPTFRRDSPTIRKQRAAIPPRTLKIDGGKQFAN
jgi:hypothetical protein